MGSAPLVRDYIKTRNEERKKHGDRFILFVEVGQFWEYYGEDAEDESNTSPAYIARVLGVRLTKRDGKSQMPVSVQNPQLLGFPTHALDKYMKILIDNGYVVGLMGQVTTTTSTKIQRKMIRVVSASTYEGPSEEEVESKVMTLYSKDMIYGISVLSLHNGTGLITETQSEDEVIRVAKVHKPVEVVILGTKNSTVEEIEMWCNFNRIQVKDETDINIRRTYENIDHQNEMMRKAFPSTGLLEPVDFIDQNLHRLQHGLISYCRILQFAYDHDETILLNVPIPKVSLIDDSEHVKMNHVALNHLNVIPQGQSTVQQSAEKTLMKILNRCQTSMGKRMFYDRMTNPITDINELERRLKRVEENLEKDVMEKVNKELSKVYDLSRLARKAGQKRMQRRDLVRLMESLDAVENLKMMGKIKVDENNQKVKQILEPFEIDALGVGSSYPFKSGFCEEMENCQSKIEDLTRKMNAILDGFNSTEHGQIFKMEKSEKDGVYFVTTQRRWNEFIKNEQKISIVMDHVKSSHVISKPPGVRIGIKEIDKVHVEMLKTDDLLKELIDAKMKEIYEKLSCYESTLHGLSNEVSDLDISVTNAKNAMEYRMVRPEFGQSEKSEMKAKGLRHLIVEEMNHSLRYIENDVTLTQDRHGILLFGINAAGKSTLMKSVGAAVIMAQSGSYVPCEWLHLTPFRKIFTRIGLTDDIYRNYSTFVMEMMELKNIIEKADAKTLVLGDELCSSTEYVSALSIVGAALQRLHALGTSYIFASHLHDLNKLKIIKSLGRMSIMHLAVRFDKSLNSLVYERKLQDGPGSDTYGIEVLKSVIKDHSFLKEAETIRKEVTGTKSMLVDTKRSRYNAKHFVETVCEVCKATKCKTEVHHIRYQSEADSEGYIDTFHKNELHNLVTLCEECHDKLHLDQLVIDGYVATANGKKLKHQVKV